MDDTNGRLTWTNERCKLSDLKPWPRNPRQIKTDQAKRLVESYEDFDQVETIAIGPDNEIYNGHQRLNVWRAKYGPDLVIDVRVSSRPLTEKEREKLVIFLHRGAIGEWDFDILANEFELEELLEWGFEKEELGFDGDEYYTGKIKDIHYQPSGYKPSIDQLVNIGKVDELIKNIDAEESITEDEKVFLRYAAYRHSVFNFSLIADYYASADPPMQRLMEDSALVILDIDDAIRLGYVELVDEISSLRQDDYGDEG